jgi:hypothetical protein
VGNLVEVNTRGPTAYLEVSEGYAMLGIVGFAKEKIPKSQLFSFLFQFSNDGDDSLPTPLWVGR